MCGNPFGTLANLARAIASETPALSSTNLRVDAPPQINCAHCHARVDAAYEWCPHCGASLRATPCAYCGRRVAAGLDDCPSCGAPIQIPATA